MKFSNQTCKEEKDATHGPDKSSKDLIHGTRVWQSIRWQCCRPAQFQVMNMVSVRCQAAVTQLTWAQWQAPRMMSLLMVDEILGDLKAMLSWSLRQYPVHQRRKWPSIKSMIGLQTIFSISRRGPTLKNLQDGKIPFDTIYHFTKSSRRFQTKAPESLLGGSLILKPLQVKNQGDGQQLETWNQWFKEETKQEQVLLQGEWVWRNRIFCRIFRRKTHHFLMEISIPEIDAILSTAQCRVKVHTRLSTTSHLKILIFLVDLMQITTDMWFQVAFQSYQTWDSNSLII